MSFAASAASKTPFSGPERRAHERVNVSVFARCMFDNKLEIPCQVINISPGDMAVVAVHVPTEDDHVIVYVDNVGRVEGTVSRVFKGGFAITLNVSARKSEKLASQIEWLKKSSSFGSIDQRRHQRMAPRQPISEIRLPDGRAYSIEIIDISISGAAIKCEVKPALGTLLTLGGMQGRVARHFNEGIAIEFATEQQIEQLERNFT